MVSVQLAQQAALAVAVEAAMDSLHPQQMDNLQET
jgi:hypothetical protein